MILYEYGQMHEQDVVKKRRQLSVDNTFSYSSPRCKISSAENLCNTFDDTTVVHFSGRFHT